MTATLARPALKEWSAAIHALLDGRQTVLLRKGGIHEKRFEVAPEVAASRFLLFPTVAHSHAERVRPEHRDLLEPAAADSTEDAIVVRAGATVVAAIAVERPEGLKAVAPFHIWTEESVRSDRLDFRPRHRLTALVVSAVPLAEPVRLVRTPDYRGCSSWVQLPVNPVWGPPVHTDSELDRVAGLVRSSVG
ncbi:DUF1802 family protein [Mycobacterium sp. 4D054]|uniref:DUF1802 family protein n=1 Tax=Mycobacterium sp. 4D054 TaxID=3457440 RepID=UPI003FD58CE1